MTKVETTTGPVVGRHVDGVLRFAGIPYAEPPVGERRWRAAEPIRGWSEPLNCSEFGPSSPQPFDPTGTRDQVLGGHGAPPFDEDCLTLNVWTPACDDARRPVLVWIHGGGFISGSGSLPIYHGDRFAAEDGLIVVTINYRLGVLGFWAPDGGECNLWLTDQIAALQWIHDNAAAFGGDPDQITVAGESGGAFSSLALATTPVSRRLIRRAILQSPPIGIGLSSVEEAQTMGAEIAEILGAATLDEFYAASAEDLVDATMQLMMRRMQPGHWSVPITPVVGSALLPRHPIDAARNGEAADVDLLLGWNTHEATFSFATRPDLAALGRDVVLARLAERFADPEAAYARYAEMARPGHASARDVLAAVETDELFAQPVLEIAEARSAAGRAALVYEFSFESPAHGGTLGATHCLELPFTFDNLDRWQHAPFVRGIDSDVAPRLAAEMHKAWVAFARGEEPEDWPRCDSDRAVKRFGATVEVVRDTLPSAELFAEQGPLMRLR